jgi:hypothetical protein
MKKLFKISALLLAVLMLVFCFAACKDKEDAAETPETSSQIEDGSIEKTGLWENAVYLKDTALGDGETTFKVEISIAKQSITLTVNTDAETVGAALLENGIIEGEDSEYGLYIKKVNGVTADFDKDKAYWAFYINGEYAMTGVDTTKIDPDVTYKLKYEK